MPRSSSMPGWLPTVWAPEPGYSVIPRAEGNIMTNTVNTRNPAQLTAMIFAVVFLVVGVAGFIPGLTTEYDGMKFAGHASTAMLLGVFCVSILHNIVHLLFGIAGFALARTPGGAVQFLLVGGAVYAV